MSSKDTSRWHLLSRNTHATQRQAQVCTSFFTSRNYFALRRKPHAGPGMHATFFVSLWKREKCANQFLMVAKEGEKGCEKTEGKDGGGKWRRILAWFSSQVAPAWFLFVACDIMRAFTTKVSDNFRWPA